METSDMFIRIREVSNGFDVSLILIGFTRPQVGQTVWAANLAAAHDAALDMRRGLHPDTAIECDIYCEAGRS